ncbi:MAG: OsmC family peroxiredoxin [Bacteroidetes bacterium]|jgi:osmotically inducible protein OsmC|nr:OsmC family peroxiredoxin [Bacteroidota bacterium]
MAIRSSHAVWEGNLPDGNGTMTIGDDVWEGPYSFRSRFKDGVGTNPEELIGAAHAGCYSMALSNVLAEAGHAPERVATTAKVHLTPADGAFEISKIELHTTAHVPGIDEAAFMEHANAAKENCPVSQLLQAAEITLQATLKS